MKNNAFSEMDFENKMTIFMFYMRTSKIFFHSEI